jgi:hypothetical protein
MTELSTSDTQPIIGGTDESSNRVFMMILLIGVLMGMVIMGLLGYGLYFFGYINVPGEGVSSTVHVTEVKIPVCATSEAISTEPNILILTPTLEPTSDFGPTATAACGSFLEQFPGTPCPLLPTP